MEILSLFDLQSRMSSVQRYSQTRLNNPESVLEHTGCVVLTCYIFGEILLGEKYYINLETLLCRAVAHDIDEIVTGDIPRPTKYFSTEVRDMFKGIEEVGMAQVCTDLEMGDVAEGRMYLHWHLAKMDTEGLIVKIADRLAVVYKAWQEYMMYGNKMVIGHMRRSKEVIQDASVLFRSYFPESILNETLFQAVEMCDTIKGD